MSVNQAGSHSGAAQGAVQQPRAGEMDASIPESLVQNHGDQFWQEARLVVGLFTLLCVGVLVLWYYWDDEYLSNDENLLYNLGLIGGILMLTQFLYSMRKRLPLLRNIGNLKIWFVVHMCVGICAPLLIIIHTRFEISSINGGVAFFAMLLVVFSGIVGRYLYSKINFDFAGARAELKRLHDVLQNQVLATNPHVAENVAERLKVFTLSAFAPPGGPAGAIWQLLSIDVRARLLFIQLCGSGGRMEEAGTGRTFAAGLLGPERQVLKTYVLALSRIARYNAFKQLFALWRIAHVPMIYLLLVAGLAHVLAVHMY